MTGDAPWAPLFLGGFALLCIWAVFWVIRLAVRYGVNDALRMNRQRLAGRESEGDRELR